MWSGSRVLCVSLTLTMFSCPSWCSHLDDGADLSGLADSMRSSLLIVSNDIAATCERRGKLLTNIPGNEKASTDKPQDCAPFHATADRVAAEQSVLIAYLDALARLVSNRPPAYRAGIAGNITTLSGDTGVSTHVVTASTAAQQILGSLADLARRGYRSKHLASLIESTDPAVQQLTAALTEVMTKDYTILLGNEQTSLANYYEVPMAEQKGERLTLILVQRQYDSDSAHLANRIASAHAYGQLMTAVAATHAHLASQAHAKRSMKKLVQELDSSSTSFKDAVATLAAAEGK